MVHGKKTVFKLDNAAGTLTDISTKCNSVGSGESLDNGETTTFGKTSKTRIVGLGDGKFDVGIVWDATIDLHIRAAIAALKAGTIATLSFEYGPEGSATGARKTTGEVIIADYQVSSDVEAPTTATLSLEGSDDFTHDTYA